MVESGEGNERAATLELLRRGREERDPKYADMTDRAAFVIELFQREHPELTSWDITCFAASWLAMQATEWLWMREQALKLAVNVAKAHYLMDEVGLISVVPVNYIEQRDVQDDKGQGSLPD